MPPAGHREFGSPEDARATDPLLAPPGVPDDVAPTDAPVPARFVVGEPMIAPKRGDDSDAGTDAPDAWVGPEPTQIVTDQMPGDGLSLDQPPTGPASTGPVLPVRAPVDPTPIGSDVPAEPELIEPEPSDDDPAPAGRVGNRWFRVRRRILAACAIAVVLGLGYYLVSLAQVWTTGRADDDGPVDAIVVMGAAQYDGRPSPQLAARLDHVVELWPQGVAPIVVVTGGNIPGDRFTEAEASATYLAERGVPLEALLLENDGSTSYESLDAVADLLVARGLDEVLIVTDPYHALRSRLIAEEVGLDATVSSTDTSVVTGGESLRRHLQEAGGVAIGRIIGFERLARLVD